MKVAVFGRRGVGDTSSLAYSLWAVLLLFFNPSPLSHFFFLGGFYQQDLISSSWRLSLFDVKGLVSLTDMKTTSLLAKDFAFNRVDSATVLVSSYESPTSASNFACACPLSSPLSPSLPSHDCRVIASSGPFRPLNPPHSQREALDNEEHPP